jgi:hypothetical protein
LRLDPKAKQLIYDEPGANETAIRWTDPITGIRCRIRPDRVVNGTVGLIVDLKTARSLSLQDFAKAAYTLGYHRQVAMYRMGYEAKYGKALPFVFVAVSKEPPHRCQVIELDGQFEERGKEEVRAGLELLGRCRKSGFHSPFRGQVMTVSMPRWAKYDDEWTVGATA